MIGTARILYGCSCLVLILCSLLLQAVFAMVCQRMKGWKSNFAFFLLQLMAFFSFLSYIGLFVSYVHGIMLFESVKLSRITGSNYQGSFFSYVITNTCLTIHRLFYTLLPIKAQFILTERVLKICVLSIFVFYISYLAFTLSPLASVVYCPAYFFFYFEARPFYPLLSMMNQVSNFLVGVVNVSAYCIMFATLFLKGSVTFTTNDEIRMTIQAAIVSFCELLFFLYWEYGPTTGLPEFWKRALDGYSMLIYFDVLILPYLILNKRVKTEMKNIFLKNRRTSIAHISSVHLKQFHRRSV
ncbi:hypothetical protein Aduo_014321 [Ancylostoma duodenale]